MPGNPFYQSQAWRDLRRAALTRDHYRCTICSVSVAGKGQARVDHIRRISDGGAPLDIDNVRTLCITHDAQGHREKGSGSTERQEVMAGCTDDGMPLDPQHPWYRTASLDLT